MAYILRMRKAVFGFLLLASCSWIAQRKALATCKFSLKEVKLVNADFKGFELELGIEARNPNRVDAVLDKLDYSVYLEGVHLVDGVVSKPYRVPAGGRKVIRTKVKVAYSDLAQAKDVVLKAVLERKAKVRVSGKAHFGPLKVPFDFEEVRKF